MSKKISMAALAQPTQCEKEQYVMGSSRGMINSRHLIVSVVLRQKTLLSHPHPRSEDVKMSL